MNRSILNAIHGTPNPPCVIYQCQHQMECAESKIACVAFHRYVVSASGRFPSGAAYRQPDGIIYERVFESC